jgi:hypothetical protein
MDGWMDGWREGGIEPIHNGNRKTSDTRLV